LCLFLVEYSKYLEEYAAHFNLSPHIRFEHEILRVERCSADKKKWRLQVRQNTNDVEWHKETFDRVAICTGTHQARAMPTLVGSDTFNGKIYHMQDVKKFDQFSGKRVCVVGSGEAASDMALASSKHGEKAFVSIRHDHGYFVSRYPFGSCIPSDLQTTRVRYSIPAVFGVIQSILWLCLGKVFHASFISKVSIEVDERWADNLEFHSGTILEQIIRRLITNFVTYSDQNVHRSKK
jgi:NADPH-dependent glutamate synthase beta subunit-like oxidoreductase